MNYVINTTYIRKALGERKAPPTLCSTPAWWQQAEICLSGNGKEAFNP